jgi:hypothetical protein
MGYRSRAGGFLPGIFRRDRIVRVSDAGSRPGDDFCALWHVLDLLPDGPAGWQPKLSDKENRR